jgi:hypothetical protein
MATTAVTRALVSPARTPDTTEAWQRAVLEELRAIRAALERQPRPSHLTRAEEARFLLVVAMAVKGRAFSAAELLAHGLVDPELRQALGGMTSRQIGKRLRTLADRDIGGLIVRRIKRDEAGTVWAVSVADLHADTGTDDDRSA